ncbi:hypothetical protein DFH27DRAFT_559126 [Peziza echinospora]|nr:hypothetical protein DFH27DRAFT_559126 [Peziza echinospora]
MWLSISVRWLLVASFHPSLGRARLQSAVEDAGDLVFRAIPSLGDLLCYNTPRRKGNIPDHPEAQINSKYFSGDSSWRHS